MAFTGRDILLAAYPVLNQTGITPLISEGGFAQNINNAILNTLVYKGNIWSFQNTVDTFDIVGDINKTLSFTTTYPMFSVLKVYTDRGNGFEEAIFHRVPTSYELLDDTMSYDTASKRLNIMIGNKTVKRIKVTYYRGQDRINTLDDKIDLPDIIRPAISYFTLSEVIPLYHTYEQGRDINYYKLATTYLDNLRQMDTIAGDRIESDLV